MSISQIFISNKIGEIIQYTAEIEDLLKFSDEEILGDSGKMHIAERLTQLIADTMIDINNHLIKELKLEPVEDIQSTFYTLSDGKVLPREFSERLAPIIGLRNRIVHRYDKLDKDLFIKTLRKECSDFKKYNEIIEKFLKKIK
ncbi:MAG: HepT-like ribonuclease domain-containing protein [Patescibacteria group bacterium]